ncbi:carbohydrate-binding module family 13 protein [Wolfiporia cocos MD-104 SS10]|uniref:Carbohydrate-binding module family 13 protein n=1 Tax=Wolfiporia cocos (strain MD-104) TaxID=742152 RepID=A0A2H3K0U1_WOLCO|nr:carbohydrate-binding module family 13 protein [Wolfiporia cocos MD-104 SS10]
MQPQDAAPLRSSLAHSIFYLQNVQSGTAMDLADKPNGQYNVKGHPLHMERNQQWKFIPLGKGYAIQSMWPNANGPLYLTVRSLADRAQVVTTHYPVTWDIEHICLWEDTNTIRIVWPTTRFAIELDDGGSLKPGTRVQLKTIDPNGHQCQLWKFMRCDPQSVQSIPSQPKPIVFEPSQSITQPLVSESVLTTEDQYVITTTRTITTITRTLRNCSDTDPLAQSSGGSSCEE